MKDFFISYNKADKDWAEWIAWELEEAGYSLVIQAWDFRPGSNFVLDMDRAATEANRTIAVLSPDYVSARFPHPEWAAAFAQDPTGSKRTLVPVVVRECDPKGLVNQIVHIKLVGLGENAARQTLLAGLKSERAKPDMRPAFPLAPERSITNRPAFPGALPAVWTVPHLRNPNFTGREGLLNDLREKLTSGKPAALTQAIH
nr:toll/interleukin-1 receptor domain-containing protein [Chloroflexota bacterium]